MGILQMPKILPCEMIRRGAQGLTVRVVFIIGAALFSMCSLVQNSVHHGFKPCFLNTFYNFQVADDEIYLVVNAGCREKDLAHIQKHLDRFTVSCSFPQVFLSMIEGKLSKHAQSPD